MDRSSYLESMGITISRRALFSYTTQPQGSYGLHVIFNQFLKEKKIAQFDRDKDHWCTFLADYIVFRLYIAKYILKDYAKDYTPLLKIFKGIQQVENDFPAFFKEEADPGRGVGDSAFLPSHLAADYTVSKMDQFYDMFNSISLEMENKPLDRNRQLKGIITAGLSALAKKNHIPLYSPIFWFFSQEPLSYGKYLADFYKGLIPDEFYETVRARPYEAVKKKDDPFYDNYHLPAFIAIFVAGLLLIVLLQTQ